MGTRLTGRFATRATHEQIRRPTNVVKGPIDTIVKPKMSRPNKRVSINPFSSTDRAVKTSSGLFLSIFSVCKAAAPGGRRRAVEKMAEEAILGYLEKNIEISDSGRFADEFGLDHSDVVNVIKSLNGFRYVDAEVQFLLFLCLNPICFFLPL